MSGRMLFIHGFGSCGNGEKSTRLRDYFGAKAVLAPDLGTDPAKALRTLEQILDRQPVDFLIGSSLGGFFAVWLNGRAPLPTVLINPALQPWRTLAPWVGKENRHWCTGEPFELTRAHLDRLRNLARTPDPSREQYLVLLGRRDEVIDHKDAARRFAEFDVRIDPQGDHRFRGLARYLDDISRFRKAAARGRLSSH